MSTSGFVGRYEWVAEQLGISKRAAMGHVAAGRLGYVALSANGRRKGFTIEHVQAFLREQNRPAKKTRTGTKV